MKNITKVYIGMTALLCAVILFSCGHADSKPLLFNTQQAADTTAISKDHTASKSDYDSTVTIQNNNFHIRFWVDTTISTGEESNNTFLLIQKGNRNLFSDSFYTTDITLVELIDLNKDGNLDLSVFKEPAGRGANEYNHWMLYNPKTQSFNRIKGVAELPSVEMDSSGLMVAHAYYGEHLMESYFFINKDFKLIDLKEHVETLAVDDTTNRSKETFDKAFKKYQQQKDK